ncbi:HEPN domain-containing protein [Cohnella silvisoli]|uniref:HEPN domain-containing protein n=1 Tax=Cohnella silvisoli TaxID=2873699 RepID=A0ABV1L1H7_9BACL|nr:HEPN domain-containing protein [Cohnella silvisoli]MCD9025434.1 hypothetical protein [Cohnella silvisoli]
MEIIKRKIEVILPIFKSFSKQYDFKKIINQVIEELLSMKIVFPLNADQIVGKQALVRFKLLDENDDRIQQIKKIGRSKIYLVAYTEMEITDIPIEGIEEWNIPSIELWKKDSVDYFIKRLYDFIISINISRVGTFQVDHGLIYVDEQLFDKTKMLLNGFEEVYIFTQKTKWPVLEQLDIVNVWGWITEKIGFIDGIGGTAVERALTALTYLFGSVNESNEGVDLFFTMIGLEALYSSSNNGIKEQLVAKSQVLLGVQNEYKKLFKYMYDYRSKFIHGGLNFPGKFHYFDGTEEFDSFMKENYDVTLMAQSVLIATLQQLSKRNLNELTFKYALI